MSKYLAALLLLPLLCGVTFAVPPEGPPGDPMHKGSMRGEPMREGVMRLTPEEEQEALEFIRVHAPAKAKWLEKIKVKRPMLYKRMVRHILHRKKRLEMLKETDPERYKLWQEQQELEMTSWELAEDYREAETDGEKEKIDAKLKETLNTLFDLREKDKEFELQRLEKEIAKLKEIIAKRSGHKTEIIDRHMNELLGEEEYLRW